MRRYVLQLAVGVLLALVGAVAFPMEGRAQSLDKLVEEARNFEDRVRRLERQYLKPAMLESKYTLETRYNDARVAYMMEDYDRASLLFVDVVRNPRIEQFESYRPALYMLGDSLYQRRNYLAAKKYFQKLIDRGVGEYYQDSVVRLLQIAARTGEYSNVEELFEQFDEQRDMGPSVQYMRGKILFEKGDAGEAVNYFNRAAQSDEWAYKSRYFKGVALAKQRKFDRALEVFQGLAEELEGSGDLEERDLLHLSYLALGRIYYEQGRVEQAIDAYQRLPRTSEHFDRALYELTWVLVKRENYRAASRNADIFLYMADPDPTFIPEVKLLKADLALRLDQYDRATVAYNEVIDQFKPLRKRMVKFLGGRKDLKGFFADLVQREFEGENPTYMPRTVQKWIDQGDTMKKSRRSIQDVARLERDIEETRQALTELQARLQSGSAIESFPELAEGMAVAIEAEHQLIRLRRELLEREYQLLESEMRPGEKRRWKQLRSELEDFEERYKKVPKTREEVQQRKQKVQHKFTKLLEELDAISFMLKGQKEQLRSIDEYVREEHGGTLPPEKKPKVEALRAEIRNNVKTLEKREKELRKRISVTRQKFGVGDRVTKRERKMRENYAKMLKERRKFLSGMHGRVSGSKRSKLRKIQGARSELPPASSRLQAFFEKMRDLVGEKTEELRKTLQREREILVERERRLQQLMKRSKSEAAKAAYNNYVRVAEKFDEIVMRGDVGLIDVAWQRKEGKTEQLNQLRENRRQALESLQESFRDVR